MSRSLADSGATGDGNGRFRLRLYVTGSSPKSLRTLERLKQVCEQYLAGRYELEVVDIYQQPALAKSERILAAPTLIRSEPEPPRRLIGDLTDTASLMNILELPSRE